MLYHLKPPFQNYKLVKCDNIMFGKNNWGLTTAQIKGIPVYYNGNIVGYGIKADMYNIFIEIKEDINLKDIISKDNNKFILSFAERK